MNRVAALKREAERCRLREPEDLLAGATALAESIFGDGHQPRLDLVYERGWVVVPVSGRRWMDRLEDCEAGYDCLWGLRGGIVGGHHVLNIIGWIDWLLRPPNKRPYQWFSNPVEMFCENGCVMLDHDTSIAVIAAFDQPYYVCGAPERVEEFCRGAIDELVRWVPPAPALYGEGVEVIYAREAIERLRRAGLTYHLGGSLAELG